ncbi:hypothetical protein COCMIDRAFT_21953 [Bipolaris oryzae ATCC 44560]|uniref:Uncharacterized protein n=1 Tax=Bipolaris oryzae ATCC 44560 TaxID=930090 RepID=W6ZSZ9_COCMI|nr:uncharacterized protein COCMIDRAFT_21953 [Bipolaris oryzae ATCC 44560]EUC50649.1 hypothetical protein COCMIDRAFT_21953 [Bipolaris oryzae ATCC 44560]
MNVDIESAKHGLSATGSITLPLCCAAEGFSISPMVQGHMANDDVPQVTQHIRPDLSTSPDVRGFAGRLLRDEVQFAFCRGLYQTEGPYLPAMSEKGHLNPTTILGSSSRLPELMHPI